MQFTNNLCSSPGYLHQQVLFLILNVRLLYDCAANYSLRIRRKRELLINRNPEVIILILMTFGGGVKILSKAYLKENRGEEGFVVVEIFYT